MDYVRIVNYLPKFINMTISYHYHLVEPMILIISRYYVLLVIKKKLQKSNKMERRILLAKFHSSFNNIVLEKVIDTLHFKTHQFVERIRTNKQESPVFKIDMRRCRKNNLYYSKYEFPVYSVMDYPTAFSGKITCGYYYVNTESTFPLRASRVRV